MGILGLWDVIGDGEIIHIADYAAQHFEKHKRPLRIAVDEACWRFTNLTPEQVQKIRDGEPAANPIEKTILWRILRLMKLNVQLLFVHDGPSKPWKKGRCGGGLLDKEIVKLLHQLLDHLKVPYHQAPGEAEAECAALEQRGIVDAVWADDGDAFMFGCQTLIKQHKVDGKRVHDHIRVYHADSILREHDLDQDSFVLFAMLAGGDYNPQGLKGCGPKTAQKAARREYGVAGKIREAHTQPQRHLPTWRQALHLTLRLCGSNTEVPPDFPALKALGNYLNPNVSAPEKLDDLRKLRQGWDRKIDQTKLRVILRDRFNMWTRGFIKHIAPVYLARALARATPEQRAENLQYGVQLKRTRKPKDGDEAKSEVKITFNPIPAVEIDLSQQPPEEDWSLWTDKDGTPYDPIQNVEAEIPQCFLDHGLPEGGVAPAPAPARRKRKSDATEPTESSSKKPRSESALDVGPSASASPITPTKRGLQKEKGDNPATKRPRKVTRKDKDANALPEIPPSPPRQGFKLPRSLPLPPAPSPPRLPSSSQTPMPPLQRTVFQATRTTPASSAESSFVSPARATVSAAPTEPMSTSPEKDSGAGLVPGETIAASTLRELRAGSSLLAKPAERQAVSIPESPLQTRPNPPVPVPEVIDLT
ncbi:hypothetical protein B0A50_02838 [Salinomyces thailandicus]|uniref:XPG-I domain-containing protein n=1 Tax=Salinomyces thailandicus TaxID=706561 RepID=A0A4V5N5Q1_9PEZI|nr:hypothetical protein B0A50_02838 [Salinomyces thailandica]